MKKQDGPVNGFAVCALILSVLAFGGTFYVYLARGLAGGHPAHIWFRLLFPSDPLLILLSLVLAITGLVTCKRYPQYKGRRIAIGALVLAGLALIHWLGWVLLARLGAGYA